MPQIHFLTFYPTNIIKITEFVIITTFVVLENAQPYDFFPYEIKDLKVKLYPKRYSPYICFTRI